MNAPTPTQPPQGVMAELRELLARATPGPWELSYDTGSTRDVVASPDPLPICTMKLSWVTHEQYAANAQLIAAMRAALPGLLDEVDRLQARADELYGEVAQTENRASALLARCEGLEAFVRDVASRGTRFDLVPTHDMSSLNAAEQFWHDYARRMDESIRERATESLAATRTTGD